jgi:hypothetical protein
MKPPPLKRGPDTCGQRFTPPRTYAPPAFVRDESGRDLIPLTAAEARRLFNPPYPHHPPARFPRALVTLATTTPGRSTQIPLRQKTQRSQVTVVVLEGETALFCMCGAGGSADELDAHFLAVFPPADLVSRDGRKHEKAMS